MNSTKIGLRLLLVVVVAVYSSTPGHGQLNTNPLLYESETLKIEKLTENMLVHITYLDTDEWGKVPCNGMIYLDQGEAIVFDTPSDNNSSKELIQWIQSQDLNIKAVVVTHFHIDCLGGLEPFHQKEIPSYASDLTIQFAKEDPSKTPPQFGFQEESEIEIGNEKVLLRYFGEGHTRDNVVGITPDKKGLFGGCLVKSMGSGKGNLEDANTSEWSNTIEKIKVAYPNLEFIVPGHGAFCGPELLDYTAKMFRRID